MNTPVAIVTRTHNIIPPVPYRIISSARHDTGDVSPLIAKLRLGLMREQ